MSKITDIESIQNLFFPLKVKLKLIYRASSESFKIQSFHKNCDYIQNTLVLLKTQFGNIIGGYTPLTWKSVGQGGMWEQDKSLKSLIFSLTTGQKFQKKVHKMQYLLVCIKVHVLEKIQIFKVMGRAEHAIFQHLTFHRIINAIKVLGRNLVAKKKDINLKFYNGKSLQYSLSVTQNKNLRIRQNYNSIPKKSLLLGFKVIKQITIQWRVQKFSFISDKKISYYSFLYLNLMF